MRHRVSYLNIWFLSICILAMSASGQIKKTEQLNMQRWTLIEFETEVTNENVKKHEIATRASRKNLKPLPEMKKQLSLPRSFTREEYRMISFGHIPKEMEDKWFVFFENDRIYFHRSWTGFCMYEVNLQPLEEGYAVKSVWVNRDPDENEETDDEFDLQILSRLIDRLLLGKRKWLVDPNNLVLNDEKNPKPFIEFKTKKKTARIFSGCSEISAKIETNGQAIKFSNFKEGKSLCSEDLLKSFSAVFLGRLERITRYEMTGGKLKLYDKDKQLLTFEGNALSSR